MGKITRHKFGSVQQKILLVLSGGLMLGMTRSPIQYYKILGVIRDEWKAIDDPVFRKSIEQLHKRGYVNKSGQGKKVEYKITNQGFAQARLISVQSVQLPKERTWDKRWRLIFSDIPEKHKRVRDSLRFVLVSLGCKQMQKSVWIYPFECREQIDFVLKCHHAQKYVSYAVVDLLTNDDMFRKHFKLS